MALPIALLGPWLVRNAQSSGESLLRTRLEESLADAANAVGNRWIDYRSSLLRMAEDSDLTAAVRQGRSVRVPASTSHSKLRQGWISLDGVADVVVVRDLGGTIIASMERSPAPQSTGAALAQPSVPVRLPVYDPASGERIAELEARLRLNALLPTGVLWSGVGGAVLALFDEDGGAPLLPLSMGPELFASDRFLVAAPGNASHQELK
jgi:hypothetical protein